MLILSLFALILLGSVIFQLPLVFALLAGLVLFLSYGLYQKHSFRALLAMSFSGVKTAGGIIITMLVIGVLTALWRASGTIAVIICYASSLIHPSVFLLLCFVLNCAVSFLTGTAFGTVATMGVICAAMAHTMGLSPLWVGGAILSGIFFGDRWSPISTSALLVCTLTETVLLDNLRRMARTALLPFLLSCLVYFLAGLFGNTGAPGIDVPALFRQEFTLSWLCLLPAVAVLVISLFRVRVFITLSVSIAISLVLCLAVQHQAPAQLIRTVLTGYRAQTPALASMISGGGLASMLNVSAILLISSCYAGLFRGTGLLDGIHAQISAFARRHGAFPALLLTSVATSAIACNQTLAAMLSHQLCGDLYADREALALDLEDTVIIIAPLIPWSIAGAVPLATVEAPTPSLLFACYLYLLPLCRLLSGKWRKKAEASPSF